MSSWATPIVEKLKNGEVVSFRPRGNSMVPKIASGDLVTVDPGVVEIEKGDMVMCKVNGHHYVHLVTAVKPEGQEKKYQISNNKGHVNGWTKRANIFGKVINVES